MNVMLGQVVCSKAGRDEGRVFIIIGIVDDKYVLVSDGDLRRFENPKKKRIKHLDITSIILEALSKKLMDSIKVTNAEIRKALAEVKETRGSKE